MCYGGVGFGGFAKISDIEELKETFFFLLHFFTKKMHRQSDSNFLKFFFFNLYSLANERETESSFLTKKDKFF